MQLEKLAAVLRPRPGSESAELGLQMLGRWRGQIYRAWFLVAIPVWIACTIIALFVPWLGLLAFWWLKPLMERAPLYVVSDRLFGGNAKLGGLFVGHARLWKDFIANHSTRRFSPSRGVLAPIAMLEGLGGNTFNKRSRVMVSNSGSLLGLSLACFFIALNVILALCMLLLLVTPEPYQWIYYWRWESSDGIGGDLIRFLIEPKPIWEQVLHCTMMFIMISVTSPIYAVCGFAVYINRRTEIECWDIELEFRKIAKRIANVGVAVLAVMLLLPQPAEAQVNCNTREQSIAELQRADSPAKREYAEVLARTEFSRCQQARRMVDVEDKTARGRDNSSDDSEWTGSGIRWGESERSSGLNITDILLVAAVLMVALMAFVVLQKLGWVATSKPVKKAEPVADIQFAETEEKLPADGDLDAARDLWGTGDHRDALALLYRTAVLRLHEHYRAPIGKGATEGDCLRWAKRHLKDQTELIRCLSILTRHWQWIAYGHRMPALDFDELVDLWSRTFARLAT